MLSNLACNCNLRLYTTEAKGSAAAAVTATNAATDAAAASDAKAQVGPARKCSKHKMMEFNSTIEGFQCVEGHFEQFLPGPKFGWYVEEDVVFTGNWKKIFSLVGRRRLTPG